MLGSESSSSSEAPTSVAEPAVTAEEVTVGVGATEGGEPVALATAGAVKTGRAGAEVVKAGITAAEVVGAGTVPVTLATAGAVEAGVTGTEVVKAEAALPSAGLLLMTDVSSASSGPKLSA